MERAPELHPREVDPERVELGLRGTGEPERALWLRQARGGHRYALELDRRLGAVAQLDRQLK